MGRSFVRSGGVNDSFNWVKFVLCLIFVLLAGQVCMWLSNAWQGYGALNVSSLTPSPYVMGIVWSLVYALMGSSLFWTLNQTVFTIRSKQLKSTAIILWSAQFALVILMSFLLFYNGLFVLSFVIASLATSIIAALVILNLRLSVPASLLLLPVLAWMIVEMYLTLIIAINN